MSTSRGGVSKKPSTAPSTAIIRPTTSLGAKRTATIQLTTDPNKPTSTQQRKPNNLNTNTSIADAAAASATAPASPVFKTSRAKTLFTQFDLDHDKYLSPTEFSIGLNLFLQSLSSQDRAQLIQTQRKAQTQRSHRRGDTKTEEEQKELMIEEADPAADDDEEQSASDNAQQTSRSVNGLTERTVADESLVSDGAALHPHPLAFDPSTPVLTPFQISSLFKECDLDRDNRLSLAEFLYRFAGGPLPASAAAANQPPKPSLLLQITKRTIKDATKISLDDLRAILDAVYDGPKLRYGKTDSIDLSKVEQVSNTNLKRLLTQVLTTEKEQAMQQKREMEEWAAHVWHLGGITQKDVDRLFHHLDVKKNGRIDLTPIFALAQLKPSRGKKSNKKSATATATTTAAATTTTTGATTANAGNTNIGTGNYLLTTVKEEHVRDFCNDLLFQHLYQAQQQHTLITPHTQLTHHNTATPTTTSSSSSLLLLSTQYAYKCHPPLQHWGDAMRVQYGLSLSSGESGYKYNLFLSERTRLKHMQRNSRDQCIDIYLVFRTECTELKRIEFYWQARMQLSSDDEQCMRIEYAVKKCWRDSELEEDAGGREIVSGWTQAVGEQEEAAGEEELSIPAIA